MNTLQEALKALEDSNKIIEAYADMVIKLTVTSVTKEVHADAIAEIVRLRAVLKKYDAFHKSMPKIKVLSHPRSYFEEGEKEITEARISGWNECVRSIDDSSLWVK